MADEMYNPHNTDLYTKEAKGIAARALAKSTIGEINRIQGQVNRILSDIPTMRENVGIPQDRDTHFRDAMAVASRALERAYVLMSSALENQVMGLRPGESFTDLGRGEKVDPYSDGE